MSQYAILCYACGSQCFRVLIKQTVMPDAQSHHHIQVCFLTVQVLCLVDGITHVDADLITFLRNAYIHLLNAARLTCNAYHFKIVIS